MDIEVYKYTDNSASKGKDIEDFFIFGSQKSMKLLIDDIKERYK